MKRAWWVLLLLFCIVPFANAGTTLPKPTQDFYVYDGTDDLSVSTEDTILALGKQLEEKTGAQTVAVVVESLDGLTVKDYALQLFNQWGIGQKDKNDGVLILVAMGTDRQVYIMVGSGIEKDFTEDVALDIIDTEMIPYLRDNDVDSAMLNGYQAVVQRMGGIAPGKSSPYGGAVQPDPNSGSRGYYEDTPIRYESRSRRSGFGSVLGTIFSILLIPFVFIVIVVSAVFGRGRRYRRGWGWGGGWNYGGWGWGHHHHGHGHPPFHNGHDRHGGFGGGFGPKGGGGHSGGHGGGGGFGGHGGGGGGHSGGGGGGRGF